MFAITSESDLLLLRESLDLECKLANGKDGQGAVPEDFWKTYSAFANTSGGVVVLGVREKQGIFTIAGIPNVAKVRKELFDTLNNPNKVSVNLLDDSKVQEIEVEGKSILAIEITRASRKERPVYLGPNPLGRSTYRRLNDGDRVVSDQEVKLMLAEQVEDSRDDRILKGFGFEDLCLETFRAYRQVFANRDPEHPWNTFEDIEFLRMIGGWRKDREAGESGLTLAGLLMFGWMSTIQEELPNYMLDYQERPEARIEQRWVDRLTLDGRWSGNLYDFYRRVYLKLTAELKVPFVLEKGERKDETPVHVALREALANVLVHADYADRASVLVVKRPDMFGFRNPGLMRIAPEIAIQGGEHDCRNRTLHKMFRLVGVGEQAGSGIPKIYKGWATQHWRVPALYERLEPFNQTLLELRMVDLLPADLVATLRASFGRKFDDLGQNERLALATAVLEKVVTHARVREMTGTHRFDITRLLQGLVEKGFLESHNSGRGAVYCIPGAGLPTPEEVFGAGSAHSEFSSEYLKSSSLNLSSSSPNLAASSPNLTGERNSEGCLIVDQLPLPVIDDLAALTPSFRQFLELQASEPRLKRKVSREVLVSTVKTLCRGRFVTLRALAELVNRKPDTLRDQYLSKLVRDKVFSLAFPTTPTHERQAYCSTDSLTK